MKCTLTFGVVHRCCPVFMSRASMIDLLPLSLTRTVDASGLIGICHIASSIFPGEHTFLVHSCSPVFISRAVMMLDGSSLFDPPRIGRSTAFVATPLTRTVDASGLITAPFLPTPSRAHSGAIVGPVYSSNLLFCFPPAGVIALTEPDCPITIWLGTDATSSLEPTVSTIACCSGVCCKTSKMHLLGSPFCTSLGLPPFAEKPMTRSGLLRSASVPSLRISKLLSSPSGQTKHLLLERFVFIACFPQSTPTFSPQGFRFSLPVVIS